ncbi:hypothetical protein U14_01530 [Candidatus Moduliflexus flocculans]|uniref:Pseudouridine synthase RsuA/RluA-like domain-containing protein n=1 Tax=Candidatus Moduliflexus flocculans TaxID=1499966 RepID=A0A0S6VYZ2_9BACT|nr:hypothetical protein U14_01530 [Candidatus Moduliflexus flocculans]
MIMPYHNYSIAPVPSYVTLPICRPPYPALLDFFAQRFPNVGRDVWRERLESGKITTDAGDIVTPNTPYLPNARLRYYREVVAEPAIPFEERILFRNEHLLVVCKPHFLPVTPAGAYVNECLLYRLRRAFGLSEIAPLHRLDRETAGVVMFSINASSCAQYNALFHSGAVCKVYEAIASLPDDSDRTEWEIENRLVQGEPWFRTKVVDGAVNAISNITLVERRGEYGLFRLEPRTGKQHQLRVHLMLIGSHILHDRYYPELQPKQPDDFARPLQLLAKELHFTDPVSGEPMRFVSSRTLLW